MSMVPRLVKQHWLARGRASVLPLFSSFANMNDTLRATFPLKNIANTVGVWYNENAVYYTINIQPPVAPGPEGIPGKRGFVPVMGLRKVAAQVRQIRMNMTSRGS
jgi:hypothetical protein